MVWVLASAWCLLLTLYLALSRQLMVKTGHQKHQKGIEVLMGRFINLMEAVSRPLLVEVVIVL